MTLAQLQSFVLVARLGSVKAAAAELGVTEPAVSVAVAALRKELGDELFVREGRDIPPADLAGERWLLGPPELDPTTGAGLLFARSGFQPADVVAYTSHAAAVAAAAAGDGVVLTLAHTVIEELRRRALVRIDVRG